MSQNPYATPSAAPGPMNRPRSAGNGEIDIGDALSDAWQVMTENWAVAIIGYLLLGLLAMVSTVTCIGLFLLVPIFYWGWTAMLLNMVDGDAEIGDLFSGFNNYGQALIAMLAFYLVSFLFQIPSFALSMTDAALDMPALSVVGQLINLVVYAVVMPRLYMAPYYIVDQEMGGFEAIKASWEATDGQWMTVILLTIVSTLVGAVGLLVLIIGILFTAPLATILWTTAYRQLEPIEQSSAAPPPGYQPAPTM